MVCCLFCSVRQMPLLRLEKGQMQVNRCSLESHGNASAAANVLETVLGWNPDLSTVVVSSFETVEKTFLKTYFVLVIYRGYFFINSISTASYSIRVFIRVLTRSFNPDI